MGENIDLDFIKETIYNLGDAIILMARIYNDFNKSNKKYSMEVLDECAIKLIDQFVTPEILTKDDSLNIDRYYDSILHYIKEIVMPRYAVDSMELSNIVNESEEDIMECGNGLIDTLLEDLDNGLEETELYLSYKENN